MPESRRFPRKTMVSACKRRLLKSGAVTASSSFADLIGPPPTGDFQIWKPANNGMGFGELTVKILDRMDRFSRLVVLDPGRQEKLSASWSTARLLRRVTEGERG